MSTIKVNTIQSSTTATLDVNSPVPSLDVTGSVSVGDYIAAWNHPTIPQPTEDELAGVDEAAYLRDKALKALRTRRNQILAETDYLALSDQTLTAEMQAYRQALRDLPANTVDRNVEHLKIMVAKDFWTTEDLTPLTAAIADTQ